MCKKGNLRSNIQGQFMFKIHVAVNLYKIPRYHQSKHPKHGAFTCLQSPNILMVCLTKKFNFGLN